MSDIDSHAHAGTAKPFFIYLPYTMTHQSRLLAPEAGRIGNGEGADLTLMTA